MHVLQLIRYRYCAGGVSRWLWQSLGSMCASMVHITCRRVFPSILHENIEDHFVRDSFIVEDHFVRDPLITMPHGQISVAWLPCNGFGDYEPTSKTC